jgi:hypothetical protein
MPNARWRAGNLDCPHWHEHVRLHAEADTFWIASSQSKAKAAAAASHTVIAHSPLDDG